MILILIIILYDKFNIKPTLEDDFVPYRMSCVVTVFLTFGINVVFVYVVFNNVLISQ